MRLYIEMWKDKNLIRKYFNFIEVFEEMEEIKGKEYWSKAI